MKPLRSLITALTALHASQARAVSRKRASDDADSDAVYLYGYRQTKGLPRVTRLLPSVSQPRARLALRRGGHESRRKK
jgi:hypothetical protein